MICLAGCGLEVDIRRACLGDVEAPQVDIVLVVCVILVRAYEFSRVVVSENKLACPSRRVCMGTLEDGLDCRILRFP